MYKLELFNEKTGVLVSKKESPSTIELFKLLVKSSSEMYEFPEELPLKIVNIINNGLPTKNKIKIKLMNLSDQYHAAELEEDNSEKLENIIEKIIQSIKDLLNYDYENYSYLLYKLSESNSEIKFTKLS